ncbi:uncharacterized protein SCHCODRAFT_02718439 [Schizophyllum commune H4-8]|nr:uncharacterized protein SCHCODRAFT_02718439 [Schizophyllum commune H4-8]KAI5885645.1 hypothetical protein SCHCODRAFT_02718439 [Schizophyllum commune H4-8]
MFKSNTALKQCIVVRRAMIYDSDGADGIRSSNEAGKLVAQISTRTTEARALAHQLAGAVADPAAPSLSRQCDQQRVAAIRKSSTPPPLFSLSCKLDSFGITLVTSSAPQRLWLHPDHSRTPPASPPLFLSAAFAFASLSKASFAFTPKRDPRPRSRSQAHPSTSPSRLASTSALKLVIYLASRLKPPVLIPSCPVLTSSSPALTPSFPTLSRGPRGSPPPEAPLCCLSPPQPVHGAQSPSSDC